MQVAVDLGLVHVEGHGFHRHVRLGDHHEGAVTLAGGCQAVGEGQAGRAVARTDQDVDVGGVDAGAFEAFTDIEVELFHCGHPREVA
ncbi:hypothetical protein D3C78_1308800 [compost metagenome]